MDREFGWRDHIGINIYWFGLNVASGVITPVLLPYLVALFVPAAMKNSYLATIRVVGLAVAMMVQPLAGMLSDRSTSRWGRRRPFILGGTVLDLLFLLVVGSAPFFLPSRLDSFFGATFGVNTAYAVLLGGIVLLQVSSNVAHGALQGLIPDLVPERERGRSSGVKAVMELLPAFVVIFVGPLVDGGKTWLTVGIIMAALLITMLITMVNAREERQRSRPDGGVAGRVLRLASLTAIFVLVTRAAVWLVGASGARLADVGVSLGVQVGVIGAAGLVGMAGAILIGVYMGAWVGIGRKAREQRPFVWWVINRLLFLAAVGSIQGFAQYFMSDVLQIPNAATMTTALLGVVALFLIPSALIGGNLADRIGRQEAGLPRGAGGGRGDDAAAVREPDPAGAVLRLHHRHRGPASLWRRIGRWGPIWSPGGGERATWESRTWRGRAPGSWARGSADRWPIRSMPSSRGWATWSSLRSMARSFFSPRRL